jgi:transcriptional regulator with XRE-family HTH domain
MAGALRATSPASAPAASSRDLAHARPDLEALSIRVGATLRSKRKESGLTLAEAAERVGISASQLSRMERAEQPITVLELMTFATLYSCSATEFFLTEDVEPIKVTRRRERVRSIRNITKEGAVVQEHLLAAGNVQIEAAMVFMPPKASSGEPLVHPGDEFLTIIDGSVQVWVGDTMVELDQGDTIYYDCAVPHHWMNPDERPATVLLVTAPALAGFTP